MPFLTTEADRASASHPEVAAPGRIHRVPGFSVARCLGVPILVALLLVCGLVALLLIEPAPPRIELPRPNPRPPLLDKPYRPRAHATR